MTNDHKSRFFLLHLERSICLERNRISKEFDIETGVLGRGENIIKAVTVSTYDSAYLRAGEIGNKFSLLVADEVHHIASEGYRQIAELFSSPFRMGLTATLEREDLLHNDIPRLIGGTVFRLEPEDLQADIYRITCWKK